jgi:hypothetical protein
VSEKTDPLDYIKNPVVAEFLGFHNSSDYNESQLEQALIDNLEKFIMELGKIKMELNNPAITLNALKESGRREMVDYLVKGGMTVDGALLDEAVIETYVLMVDSCLEGNRRSFLFCRFDIS